MRIAGAATALPPFAYDQATIAAAIRAHWGDRLEDPTMLERLHARTGVERRYLARPLEEYPALIQKWGAANDVWIKTSVDLGKQAICRAVAAAGIDRQDLGAIFFVSVTGVSSPSIDAKLVNELNL